MTLRADLPQSPASTYVDVDQDGITRAVYVTDGSGPLTRAVRRHMVLQRMAEGDRRRPVARGLS
ncbi:hypothetical protein [Streptomyces sp. WELS2]|uniref:hypothetical protein n=1 Tax=Streptomyces sp. WELS2 TaxID=2749435 RepID=UPI0015F0415B|nr:hypothetical protein [Streptomyces sp. WELS2]